MAKIMEPVRELFKTPEPKTFKDFVLSRLPAKTLLNVSDVALAFDVSVEKIYTWLDDGSLEGTNIGTADKAYYKICRQNVIEHLDRLTRHEVKK